MRQLLMVCSVVSILTPAGVAADRDLPPIEMELESRDEASRLIVRVPRPDGSMVERSIRETSSALTAGEAGRDPRALAAFATWTENGSESWFAYSRDGGDSWSEPRPLATSLRLHDGAVAPGRPMPRVPHSWSLPGDRNLFIVQLETVALPEWRSALAASGVELLRHFPHNAFIARMPRGIVSRVAALEFVERIEPYHPWYRVERELRDWSASARQGAGGEERRVRVMSFEWGPESKLRILELAQAGGARPAEFWPSGHVLELWLTPEQLRAVAGMDEVLWIDRWSPPETDMDLVRQDAGTDWLETNFTWCGQGVRGEVMDEGLDPNHQDFDTAGVLLHTLFDVQSHGTHSYGVVFGNGDRDGDGDANATGHMPCAQQGIFADLNNFSDRFAHTAELKGAPFFAAFQTNSWGSARTTQYDSFSSEMDDIIWRNDIVITQSQSNAGTQNSRPQAWAKNVIAVGGIDHQNTLDTADDSWAAGNASIGPAADGRIKPDLHYWYDSIYTTTTSNGYTNFCCTSAATAAVAGTMGLLAQMWSENVWNTNPVGNSVFEKLPHASTLRAIAINTAEQYPFSGTTHDLTRTHQGWGRPNLQNAEQRAAASFIVDEENPLLFGEKATYAVDVAPGESELKVT
ncbi:MAG: S8 family serine peptidase, partial [Acidobacteriota bacterium]|nr:S8 family serine peptidase [Acidobacteriota bacterium]